MVTRARFWSKVEIGGKDECWRWLASFDGRSYGQFCLRHGKNVRAHRYAYEQIRGLIPPGLDIDHLCRNRWCVNPWHLEIVTRRTNLLRGDTLAAGEADRTHCPSGHPYDEENTYHYRGLRYCRACRKRHQQAAYRKRRAV